MMKLRYKDPRMLGTSKVLGALLVGGLVFLAAVTVLANDLVSYTIDWWTMDGGGGVSVGSGYTLGGAAGQPEAGPALTGGGYTLVGGMWTGSGPAANSYEVYLPLVLKEA